MCDSYDCWCIYLAIAPLMDEHKILLPSGVFRKLSDLPKIKEIISNNWFWSMLFQWACLWLGKSMQNIPSQADGSSDIFSGQMKRLTNEYLNLEHYLTEWIDRDLVKRRNPGRNCPKTSKKWIFHSKMYISFPAEWKLINCHCQTTDDEEKDN